MTMPYIVFSASCDEADNTHTGYHATEEDALAAHHLENMSLNRQLRPYVTRHDVTAELVMDAALRSGESRSPALEPPIRSYPYVTSDFLEALWTLVANGGAMLIGCSDDGSDYWTVASAEDILCIMDDDTDPSPSAKDATVYALERGGASKHDIAVVMAGWKEVV